MAIGVDSRVERGRRIGVAGGICTAVDSSGMSLAMAMQMGMEMGMGNVTLGRWRWKWGNGGVFLLGFQRDGEAVQRRHALLCPKHNVY